MEGRIIQTTNQLMHRLRSCSMDILLASRTRRPIVCSFSNRVRMRSSCLFTIFSGFLRFRTKGVWISEVLQKLFLVQQRKLRVRICAVVYILLTAPPLFQFAINCPDLRGFRLTN